MEINKNRIKERFNKTKEYIYVIEQILEKPFVDFKDNFDNQIRAERSFEVITQIMLDVCTHIIAMSKVGTPTTYADCMVKLNTLGIFRTNKSEELVKLIKMRNIITHQYDSINFSLLYEGLKELLVIFEDYKNSILKWIEKF